jgi:hypothetical protein
VFAFILYVYLPISLVIISFTENIWNV